MYFNLYTLLLLFSVTFELNAADDFDEEVYSISTSVIRMKELLASERTMVDILSSYADELEQKLTTLREAIDRMRTELEKSESNAEIYLSNPINAFSLVRRMHAHWHNWKIYLKKPIGLAQIAKFEAKSNNRPNRNEVIDAIHSIHRIKITYDLHPADMARGFLNGKQYDVRFSTVDLFSIGAQLLNEQHIFDAGNWLHAALGTNEISSTEAAFDFDRRKLYELYKKVLYKQQHFAHLNEPYTSDLDKFGKTWGEGDGVLEWEPSQAHKLYQKGCRGEFPMRPYSLHCRYNTTAHDFLKLAPFKMEEISLDPYVVLYHDVLSDREIEYLKSLTQNGLRRSRTVGGNGSETNDYRTSQSYWLDAHTTEITRRIGERIFHMTRLDMRQSEKFEILNYGIGGHVYMHTDDLLTSAPEHVELYGDRISTVIFYMSDVEQGGATVFPFINLAFPPQKGAALMWYNLDNRGDHDPHTYHAGCPILVGSKWVLTKWISDRFQFRAKPCPKE